MRPILLLAAGGLAREVLEVVRAADDIEVTGFLDDDPSLWGSTVEGLPVVGEIASAKQYDQHGLIVCAGNGAVRRGIVKRLDDLGIEDDRYVRAIPADVSLPPSCRLGSGTVMLHGSVITSNVVLGSHVVVMPNVTLTHDVVVEDYATLAAGVSLGGGVHVGEAVFLGMNATVREHVTLGEESRVGMGAVVIRDVPAGRTVVGVPAECIETLTEEPRS